MDDRREVRKKDVIEFDIQINKFIIFFVIKNSSLMNLLFDFNDVYTF
jgi:hypothetical protein